MVYDQTNAVTFERAQEWVRQAIPCELGWDGILLGDRAGQALGRLCRPAPIQILSLPWQPIRRCSIVHFFGGNFCSFATLRLTPFSATCFLSVKFARLPPLGFLSIVLFCDIGRHGRQAASALGEGRSLCTAGGLAPWQ